VVHDVRLGTDEDDVIAAGCHGFGETAELFDYDRRIARALAE
jgi:hypothetical protein